MPTLNKITQLAIQLDNYHVIEISGVDSQTFLQGQLTCDVVKMPEKSSTLAAHCDPKGKIVSLFRLIKFSSQQFWFIFEASLLPSALDQLKKYAVFSKVDFITKDLSLYAFTADQLPEDLNIDTEVYQTETDTILHITATEQEYYLVLTEAPRNFTADQNKWKALNILNNYPLFTAHCQGEFIPQALNLQHLEQAISFSKGCYIGQETIARAKYRGANKLAMFTLISDVQEDIEIGNSVEISLESGWRRTGTIINFTYNDQQTWLQVVLNKDISLNSLFRLYENGATYQVLANKFITE
ncbi:folate-binding protein YgfZ [Gallibacterium trehalosifermentans]|uniref:Folate-binding protein YgfZ n=1 Tax=Gallibacterium trehalosifermentans TaxID=516935 RepID=A0ABV6H2L1_9PAST